MNCPACRDVTLVMTSREGVEIDHCPRCRGVWLDRGELDKIIERAAAFIAAPPRAGERRWEDRWEDRGGNRWDDRKRRKRRSFLEELFDFD